MEAPDSRLEDQRISLEGLCGLALKRSNEHKLFLLLKLKLLVLFPTVAHKFCPLDSLFKSPSDSTENTFNPHP